MLVGILLALATSVAWGIANVFIRRSGQEVGSVRAMFWALFLGGIAAAGLGLLLDRGARDFSIHNLGLLGLCVAFGLVANVGMFHAFAAGRLTVAVPVVSGWSLVSAAVAVIFFGERVRLLQGIAAGAVFIGMMVVAMGSAGGGSQESKSGERSALIAAFAAALGFGALLPILSHLGPAFGEVTASALLFFGYSIVGWPVARLFGRSLAPPKGGVAWRLVVIAGVAEVAGVACLVLARRYAPMTVVGPLSSLAATFTVAYAWVVLRDRPSRLVITGGILVCVGLVALAL